MNKKIIFTSLVVFFFIGLPTFISVAQEISPTVVARLVKTIDTSKFSPPSPDPAGITYLFDIDRLLISDSEVNEMPIYAGANLFEITLNGYLVRTASTLPFSSEPTGISLNPDNGHLFFSDDSARKIFELDSGSDGQYATHDDIITSFSTQAFGSNDPEGVAFGQSHLFIIDGVNRKVYEVTQNGSIINNFDVSQLGFDDPEGIAFNSDNGTLLIVDKATKMVAETTISGTLIRKIDISAAKSRNPAGVIYAPTSDINDNPKAKNLYIVARGVDNGSDPNENDGRIYEMSVLIPSTNGDLNSDGKVDIVDLGILLSNWNSTSKPPADINQDGKVDVVDLGILLSNWG